MSDDQKIKIEHGGARAYFWQTPNMVDDADLDVYEFRLLSHYLRVGECWESTRTTAEKCNMGVGTVAERRRSLEAKGWIDLTEPKKPGDTVNVTVRDRWAENVLKYTRSSSEQGQNNSVRDTNGRSPDEQARSPDEQARSPDEQARSSREPKNTTNKNNTVKKSEEDTRAKNWIETVNDGVLQAHPYNAKQADESGFGYGFHVYAVATGSWPGVTKSEYIAERLSGMQPVDLELLRDVFQDWIAHDYNPRNVAGILDWYERNTAPTADSEKDRRDDDGANGVNDTNPGEADPAPYVGQALTAEEVQAKYWELVESGDVEMTLSEFYDHIDSGGTAF